LRAIAWAACAVAFVAGCTLELGAPCERAHEQDLCPAEAVCAALHEPAADICRDCVVEIEGTRVCRLRCAADADCDTDDECVDVATVGDAGEPLRYDVCLPRDRAA
jgi:hypothetical protein